MSSLGALHETVPADEIENSSADLARHRLVRDPGGNGLGIV